MENEIKVGEYVRTKEGYIAKCIEVDEDGDYYTFDNYVEVQYGDKFYSLYDDELKNIVKHSPKLKDLIEVGDYVNGWKVLSIAITLDKPNEIGFKFLGFDNLLYEIDIKTIATKEMMESISYKATKM